MQDLVHSYCNGGMWCVRWMEAEGLRGRLFIQQPHCLRVEAVGQSGGSGTDGPVSPMCRMVKPGLVSKENVQYKSPEFIKSQINLIFFFFFFFYSSLQKAKAVCIIVANWLKHQLPQLFWRRFINSYSQTWLDFDISPTLTLQMV